MRPWFRQSAFCCLVTVPFCSLSKAGAQITVDRQAGPSTQIGPPLGPGQFGLVTTGGADFGIPVNAEVVKNRPYQAQANTEIKQTLADGSHIVQTTTATVARDGDGRTVRVQKLSTMGPWKSVESSPGNSQMLTTIFDPVAQEHIDYTSDSKVAHALLMPSVPPGTVVRAEGGFSVSGAPNSVGGVEKGLIVSGGGPAGDAVQ